MQLYIYFAILVVAFALLLTEKLRTDLVAVLVVIALAATGILSPQDALSGFSSEPAIIVASIFVLTAALHQTGVSDTMGGWVGRLAGSSYSRMILVIMPAVALLSAFTHHVTTTAVMLPVALTLAREKQVPASKLLMPLSFAASLGTTITIIGAPAFLLASKVLEEHGRPPLGVFSIAPIGLALSAMGTLFVLLTARFLLPSRRGAENGSDRFRLAQYFTEITILPDSPLKGRTIDDVHRDNRYAFEVDGWLREGQPVPRPYGPTKLEDGDVLLVRTSPDEIVNIRQDAGMELHPAHQYEANPESGVDQKVEELDERLVQAVLAPRSELVNRTLAEVDFRRRYGAIVLGMWRRRGRLLGEMAHTKLREGDVLVLQGDDESLTRVAAQENNFLMLVPFHGELRRRGHAPLAAAIMLGTIVSAALGAPLEIAALAGASATVLTGCLSPRQAYRAIDQRIFVFIAGAIPLGVAMTKTGASTVIAGWLQAVVGGWNEWLVLAVIFTVVAILTQFMSDAATTALFAPVAVVLAASLGHSPEAYVVTVAMASVAAFLTPIGHHGNLLIYGPGGYQFSDFVRVGAPLTVLVGLIVTFLARLLWPG